MNTKTIIMENTKTKTPVWYWVVAIIFLLWNIMGVLSFLTHTFISEEALAAQPEEIIELYGGYPLWTSIVFAIAVFGGLFGAIGLLLKRKWAKLAFVISFCAIVPQMIHNVFFTKSIEVYGPGQAAMMPIMLVVFGLFLIWFSSYSIKKGWLS